MANVSATLIRDARKRLKSNMADSATIARTGVAVPCLVIVQRWAVPLHGVLSDRIRTRKWNVLMPASSPGANPDPAWGGTGVNEGDRIIVPGHGTFIVTEVTDPNTFNAATSCWCVLANANVTFRRPGRNGAQIPNVDVFIQRVNDELRNFGVMFEWEVLFDASLRYPGTPFGGNLISQDDEMDWPRSPNPLPNGGTVVLNRPRYEYGHNGDPIVSAYFKEAT
ncbi:MAG: hypothetical protein LC754_10315 [Acidobacteria bacterium]|nr:hypothetical protein [Acidobacteriota bacterium]